VINAEVFVELARKSEMILYETPNEFERSAPDELAKYNRQKNTARESHASKYNKVSVNSAKKKGGGENVN
jgi:hypothetical protein